MNHRSPNKVQVFFLLEWISINDSIGSLCVRVCATRSTFYINVSQKRIQKKQPSSSVHNIILYIIVWTKQKLVFVHHTHNVIERIFCTERRQRRCWCTRSQFPLQPERISLKKNNNLLLSLASGFLRLLLFLWVTLTTNNKVSVHNYIISSCVIWVRAFMLIGKRKKNLIRYFF